MTLRPMAGLAALWMAGCSLTPGQRAELRAGVPTDVKPQGVVFEREDGEFELGPAPYGHIRIVGEPVPESVLAGGYGERDAPLVWSAIGPRPISSEYWAGELNAGGRVVSIAPHPTDANTCYIASASGGIWKTTNGGTNWTPLTDELSTLNHGCVALDPTTPSTVYAGTGEYQQGSAGDGLFKSVDAGVTWTRIATAAQVGNQCSGLAISPTDGRAIHVTSSAGYHRTLNGGTGWSTLISGNCSALEINPANPQIVYVAKRGTGILRSTNGGTTFALLAGGLPTSGFDRIVMDLCASNPNVLYAAFINGSQVAGLYKTTDGGATWVQLTTAPNFCTPQCWYDAYVGVNPANENMVYCGGVDPRYATAGIVRSINGGNTWTEVTGNGNRVHPDHHAIAWGPTGIVWEGSDGGICKSTNGTTWTNVNATLAASQMYHVALHPTSPARVLAGTQDNGTPERTSESTNWPQLQAGDGGYSAFDPTNTTRRYTTYVYLTLYRWAGTNSTDITGPWGSDATNWISPFVIDPNSSTTLVAGTNRVWRTTDATVTTPAWTAISDTSVSDGGTINCLAVARGASNTIYCGNRNGGVWITTNLTTWTRRSTGLPTGEISTLVVDPGNPARAYVAFYNTTGARVLRTTNTGLSWTNVTGTLASGVAGRALAVDFAYEPPVMYLGAGSGVYVSLNDGRTWTKDDATLPNVNIGSLAINTTTRQIIAGTYGRGAWRAALAAPVCIADFNQDGGVDGADVEAFFLTWESGDARADVNEDGGVDGGDVEAFFRAWETGGC